MKHLRLFFALAAITTFTACDMLSPCGASKEEFLTSYTTFVKEIKAKELAYDAKEWESHDREFKQMVEDCYKKYEADLTTTEEVDFWTNALAYYYYRYGTDMVSVLNDNSDGLSVMISDKVEEVIDNPMIVIGKILGKDKASELEDILKDFENLGERFKKLFE